MVNADGECEMVRVMMMMMMMMMMKRLTLDDCCWSISESQLELIGGFGSLIT